MNTLNKMKKISDFFKAPFPPKQYVIKFSPTQPPPSPQSHTTSRTPNAAKANPLFPTQSQFHMKNNTTSSMSSSLNHTLSPQSPQPKIQTTIQRPSSNNNRLEWSITNINNQKNNSQELIYGEQLNNMSIRRHNFVNEYTEFVIKNCPVQTIKSYTKVDQYAYSKINRRSTSNNNNNNNSNNGNNLPSSSTIICNNRRKIKNNNNNNNTNSKTLTNILNGKKLITSTATLQAISSPNVTTSAIMNNCNNNSNDIISLNSRNMQVLLKRCKTAPATAAATTTTTTSNNNHFLPQTLTLPGRGIVLKQHNQPDTYVIEDQTEDDDDDEEEEVENNEAAIHLSRTAQILRKFRIPKTTALLPKMVAANNKCLINTDDLSGRSVVNVSAPTPPPTVGTPNSSSSSVDFLEEVIEGVDEDDMQDDTEAVIIDAPLSKEEILEESDEFVTGENYLTEDGLLSTTSSMSNMDNGNGNTVIMSTNSAGTAAPLQLQTLQPNGAITCINLPPNTILLSAADGTILATTAPAGNSNNKLHTGEQASHQQQQLIALQDWPGSGSNVGMLPQNGTTTMLLTSDGTAIPILQQSMAAAAAANELLKTQVLA